MVISEILSSEAILTSIKASSKKRVLQEISAGIANVYDLNQSEVFFALQERENLVKNFRRFSRTIDLNFSALDKFL